MAAIMVVDDEPEIVTLLRFVLEQDGHSVSAAGHGLDALEKLGVEPAQPDLPLPNLIVLDIMMPVMDGYQLNMRLQSHPGHPHPGADRQGPEDARPLRDGPQRGRLRAEAFRPEDAARADLRHPDLEERETCLRKRAGASKS